MIIVCLLNKVQIGLEIKMKKWVIVLALSVLCGMSVDSNRNTDNISDSGVKMML